MFDDVPFPYVRYVSFVEGIPFLRFLFGMCFKAVSLQRFLHLSIGTIPTKRAPTRAHRSLVTPQIPSLVAVTNVMLKFRHL